MEKLKVQSPFNSPVYHMETVTSTMDISRQLAAKGEKNGTVIIADFQEAGRGRINDRKWEMQRGVNLSFTILLRYTCAENIPPALTLRIGLAISFAIEDFEPSLQGLVKVKWPNDIMIGGKKAVGILCEADGGIVHAGIGINTAQSEFPHHLRQKATSLTIAANREITKEQRLVLLEKILVYIHDELKKDKENLKNDWQKRLEDRLYKRYEDVLFIDGAAGSGKEIKGQLFGIGKNGELLIIPNGEKDPQAFVTGELSYS